MASFAKREKSWQAQVFVMGQRRSKTFPTKAQAQAWAEIMEQDLRSPGERKSLKDALEKYRDEVCPTKRGVRWERVRINRFLQDIDFLHVPVSQVQPEHIQEWRDARLAQVMTSSVNREITLLSSVFQAAILDWRWCKINPVRLVRRPSKVAPRTRRVSAEDEAAVLLALGFKGTGRSFNDRVGLAFQFAIETAMRAGEICNLTWEHVHPKHVHLTQTKNGTARDVPLTVKAREILDTLRPLGEPFVFGLTSASLDALFRRARDLAGVGDLHFHDARREATTRLAKKVPIELLAKITGHKDMRILLTTYYRPDMAGVADLLG